MIERTSERILNFMKKDANKKYKLHEICEKLNIRDGIARRALSNLMYHKEIDSIVEGANRCFYIRGR